MLLLPEARQKTRPVPRQDCQCRQPALRMIQRARAAQTPCVGWQNESLELIAVRPPTVPQLSHIFARRFLINIEIRLLQKTSSAEEQCLTVANIFTQQPQREALCEKCKRQLVFLVTERTGDLLKERFVASVGVNLVANPFCFLSQTNCAAACSTLNTRSSGKSLSGA